MQKLLGLPVRTFILAEQQDHLIGKSSIENLDPQTLLEAGEVIGSLRSNTARRVSRYFIAALVGAFIHPGCSSSCQNFRIPFQMGT